MNDKTKRLLLGIFTIILIGVMFIFVDINRIITNLNKISFFGVFLFVLIYSGVFLLRTYRLNKIFQGLNLNISNSSLFFSFGIGWAINEVIPGKIGDLARIEVINEKNDNLNLSQSICGITIERVIDLLFLFSITFTTLLYLYLLNIEGTLVSNLQFYIGLGAIILSLGIIILILLFFKTNWVLNTIGKISAKLRNLFEKFLKIFLEGINNFRKNKKEIIIVIFSSLIIWISETSTILLIFFIIGVQINAFVIILAQITLFFSKTFPITPGGWVVSENIGSLFIILFYPVLPYDNILSLFILDHILRISYLFVFGIGSSLSLNFKFKNLKKELNLNSS